MDHFDSLYSKKYRSASKRRAILTLKTQASLMKNLIFSISCYKTIWNGLSPFLIRFSQRANVFTKSFQIKFHEKKTINQFFLLFCKWKWIVEDNTLALCNNVDQHSTNFRHVNIFYEYFKAPFKTKIFRSSLETKSIFDVMNYYFLAQWVKNGKI